MPRENRKRGKKHKKNVEEAGVDSNPERQRSHEERRNDELQHPSWIRSTEIVGELNPEAPYGYVDNDVKAYFRTVDVQIKDWQENNVEETSDGEKDPNEDRHMFFVAALSEMTGKEKQLATDPDCSIILERMAHSMDDFVRRVFVDSLAGSFEILAKHRFASHVIQTMFTVARDTVSRETRGIMPIVPEAAKHGELRTMSQLVLDACEELLPSLGSLIMDPFASHVIRSLLVLLTPRLAGNESSSSSLRSKKSQKWKSKQGQMKSLFSEDKGGGDKAHSGTSVPQQFQHVARRFVESLRKGLSDNEIRALAADKAASPALQMLMEVEADQSIADVAGSLLDNVTMGLVSSRLHDQTLTAVEPSDYVNTLLRDTTSSHLLEVVIARCPDHLFRILWKSYFSGKLPRLAVHPVANFVVAKAIDRLSPTELSAACEELDGSWSKFLQSMRIPVLKTFVDRAASLRSSEDAVVKAVCSAFGFDTEEDRTHIVHCVLHLVTLKDAHANTPTAEDEQKLGRRPKKEGTGSLEPTIHGSQLLQALLRLSEHYNELVIESLISLPIATRIRLTHNQYSSRVYDALLDSPTVPLKAKRKIVMDFIGHYHVVVDDRIGSRIVDHCWAFADTYLKEKIARSLITHDRDLAASYYGRFFARNLNLQLLQRRPDEWRNMQVDNKKKVKEQQGVDDSKAKPAPKRKREQPEGDEIGALFDSSTGKKIKRAALGKGSSEPQKAEMHRESEKELQGVLDAIKAAPSQKHERRKATVDMD